MLYVYIYICVCQQILILNVISKAPDTENPPCNMDDSHGATPLVSRKTSVTSP